MMVLAAAPALAPHAAAMSRTFRTATASAGVAIFVAVVAVTMGQEVAPPPRQVESSEEKAAKREIEVRTHQPTVVPDRVILTWKGAPPPRRP